MNLDEYIEEMEPDEAAERKRLARQKSYELLDYLDDVRDRFEPVTTGTDVVGSTAPSIFVGRYNYPQVSTGILSPVGAEDRASEFETSDDWYHRGLDIESVLKFRTGLLNSNRSADINVHDVWDGFVGAQRQVAIADQPIDIQFDLSQSINLDLDLDDVTAPTGPRARVDAAQVTESPRVRPSIQKTLEDDEWNAEGAMTYLYRRGFDVYDINRILSAGALGTRDNRRLVPTRWSITAVDDTIGQYLRGRIRNNRLVNETQVWMNEYMGNRYWVILAPGQWEYELVEMKAPGSIWNQDPTGQVWMGAAHEGYAGRSGYVEETAGAYYAARLGVLEHLNELGRQAKALVLREVSDEYWAPVGVWQIRESVRNAFTGDYGEAETFHGAVAELVPQLPVSYPDLQQKSHLLSGLQSNLLDFQLE